MAAPADLPPLPEPTSHKATEPGSHADGHDLPRRLRLLEQQVAEYETLLRLIPVGISIVKDASCKRVVNNPHLALLLGHTPDDNASIDPDAPDATDSYRVFRNGEPMSPSELPGHRAIRERREVVDVEFDAVVRGEKRVTLVGNAAPVFGPDGEPCGAVVAFVNITQRKEAEELEQRARIEAERGQERARFLDQVTRTLASSLDHEATERAVTRLALPTLADFALLELVDADGTLARTHDTWFPETLGPTLDRLGTALDREQRAPLGALTGGAITFEPAVDAAWLARAGLSGDRLAIALELGIRSLVSVKLEARGRTIGVLTLGHATSGRTHQDADVALARDLAGRAALAVENARLYLEAQRANRLKDEFLATVSHELRSPLTPILGWVDVLRRRDVKDPMVGRALEVIARNVHRQNRLIEDLLDVSRSLLGSFRIQKQSLNLATLVEGVVESMLPSALAKGIDLESKLPATAAASFMGDPERLQQVVANLLSNAIKFTPEGGKIEVSLSSDATCHQIAVSDSGDGIAAEDLGRVFDRFWQATESPRRSRGLGLGLSIVRHIVELHGGRVAGASEGPRRGSTFTVTLPRRHVPE